VYLSWVIAFETTALPAGQVKSVHTEQFHTEAQCNEAIASLVLHADQYPEYQHYTVRRYGKAVWAELISTGTKEVLMCMELTP
jgi:hypothetical protein